MKRVLKMVLVPILILALSIGMAPNVTDVGLAKKVKKKVYSVKITNTKQFKKLYVGDRAKVKYTVKADKKSLKKVSFTSSNKKAAKINKSGVLTVVGKGKTTIKVTSTYNKKKYAKVILSFKQKPAEEVEDNLEDVSFKSDNLDFELSSDDVKKTGYVFELGSEDDEGNVYGIETDPEDVEMSDFTWSSSNKKVVKVDSAGDITIVGFGTATVTVTYKGNSEKNASITITVTKADSDDDDEYGDDDDDDDGDWGDDDDDDDDDDWGDDDDDDDDDDDWGDDDDDYDE